MDYKKYIADKINVAGVGSDEIASSITLPPNSQMGDYALPCFKFAKVLRKSPVAIAEALAADIIPDDVISEVTAVNGYVNFRINKDGLSREVIQKISDEWQNYGGSSVGAGKTVCIDYSPVNIA